MTVLDIVLIVVLLGWLGGVSFGIGGSLIHLLLVVALVALIARLLGVGVHAA